MVQWREQCRITRRMEDHPPTTESTHALHPLPKPPLLLNPCPPLTWLLTLLPRWPNGPTPSPIMPEQPPFPQGNNIIVMLHWLNKAGEGLTDEVLLEWALDVLHSPEDWRWLWSLEPATTPLSSPTPNHPPQPWYGASSANYQARPPPMPRVHMPLLSHFHPWTPSMNLPYATLPHLWRPQSCGHQLPNRDHSLHTFSPSPNG